MIRYYGELNDTTDIPAERYMQINSAGMHCAKSGSDNFNMIRKNGRKDYYIIYVHSGQCDVHADAEPLPLFAGDMYFYRPGESQNHIIYGSKSTCSYFIHFTGFEISSILDTLNLNGVRFCHFDNTEDVVWYFQKIYFEYQRKDSNYQEMCIGYLLQLLTMISRVSDNPGYHENKKINSVLKSINEHYYDEINIAEFARQCNFSVNYFSHIFKEAVGVPPYKYLTNVRLHKAKNLFRDSTMNISEVAYSIGFTDPLYFSRAFKKRYGITPSEYRRECRMSNDEK